jgi:hypothetical protein
VAAFRLFQTTLLFSLAASDVSAIDDLDELEVYGSEEKAGTQLSSYTFEVGSLVMTYL